MKSGRIPSQTSTTTCSAFPAAINSVVPKPVARPAARQATLVKNIRPIREDRLVINRHPLTCLSGGTGSTVVDVGTLRERRISIKRECRPFPRSLQAAQILHQVAQIALAQDLPQFLRHAGLTSFAFLDVRLFN